MTFFLLARLFSPFFVKIQLLRGWRSNIGGMYPPTPPRDLQPCLIARLQIRVQHWGGKILRFLFLMTFFFARQAFFHHFLLKFNYWGMEVKYWGDVSPIPPGFAALFNCTCSTKPLSPTFH